MNRNLKIVIIVMVLLLIVPTVVVLFFASFYAVGLYNPYAFVNTKVTGFPNIGHPEEWERSSNGDFWISVKNGLTDPITIIKVTSNCGTSQAEIELETPASPAVNPGGKVVYSTSNCMALTEDTSYSVVISVEYVKPRSAFAVVDTGTVVGSVV